MSARIIPSVLLAPGIVAGLSISASVVSAQDAGDAQSLLSSATPVHQFDPGREAEPRPFTLRDVASPDRWIGQEARDVRWALDGSAVYFRWHADPEPDEDPDLDPWFRVDRDGTRVVELPDSLVHLIPPVAPSWDRDGRRATWSSGGALYLWDAEAVPDETPGQHPDLGRTRILHSGASAVRFAEMSPDEPVIHFMLGEDLHRHDIDSGAMVRLTRRHTPPGDAATEMGRWLRDQELDLFAQHRDEEGRRSATAEHERETAGVPVQAIPLPEGVRIDRIQVTPDGATLAIRWTRPNRQRPSTVYADYLDPSGYTQANQARAKVGEPRDERGLALLGIDPRAHPDSLELVQVTLPDAEERATVIHGPWWSLEGDRAAIQVLSEDHKDLWIALLDPETGATEVIEHQHDPAWIGGPPIQGGSLQPTLLAWLPGGSLAFASEASGWSHLYLAESDGTVRSLTEGEWEVRQAGLSVDRTRWLLQASREHPADDHLYLLPARGGELERITERGGRSEGLLSPDGERIALLWGETVQLPDLFLMDASEAATETRVTVSGSERLHARTLVRPEIVSFAHPDGEPVWAALYLPEQPNDARAAVMHIHGGGYRQFAHRGWSVYGFANHVGFIHWLLEQGYTVLDFDYRGSAGFGRDYRTDIYRSMGVSDVDGAVAGVDYLAREHGIDPGRVGMYGVSYGGFFTLMSLFRYPGVFAAGVSNDGVTDWAPLQ
jgi:dipeptidyl aminopeptidase/acylaminoacyl peptidase